MEQQHAALRSKPSSSSSNGLDQVTQRLLKAQDGVFAVVKRVIEQLPTQAPRSETSGTMTLDHVR